MTDFIHRIAAIIPADWLDRGRSVSYALGFQPEDGNTFAAPLSADGQEPATHYGLSTVGGEEFRMWISGEVVPDVVWDRAPGLDRKTAINTRNQITYDVQPAGTNPGDQFDNLAASIGLQRIRLEENI